MAICQYFLRGVCRFGTQCRNEHPADKISSGTGNITWNRVAANLPYSVESMTTDLTPQKDKPLWPLSVYAPAKGEPSLLTELDESPEELRIKAHLALKNGSMNEYLSYEANKLSSAEQIFTNARNNINQAFERAQRNTATTTSNPVPTIPTSGSAFGGPGSSSTFSVPAISQPAFGQAGFGQPAFGQPSQPQSSLIKPASGAFTSFSGPENSSFGSNATTAGNVGGGAFSAFAGTPSTFGGGSTGISTSIPSGGSVFGQPAFGQTGFASAASTQGPSASAFGSIAPASSAAFGTAAPNSAFGITSNPGNTNNIFGNVSPARSSAFGNSTAATPAFGSPAFGTPSVFGALQANPPNVHQQQQSALGQSAFAALGQTNTFGGGTGSTFGSFNQVQQPTSAFGQMSPGQPQPTPGQPSSKRGAPIFTGVKSPYRSGSTPYDQQLPPNYMDLLPAEVLDAFKALKFEPSKIPEWIPPIQLR